MHRFWKSWISAKSKICKSWQYFAKYPYEIKSFLQVLYEVYSKILQKPSVQNYMQHYYNCSTFYRKSCEKMNTKIYGIFHQILPRISPRLNFIKLH